MRLTGSADSFIASKISRGKAKGFGGSAPSALSNWLGTLDQTRKKARPDRSDRIVKIILRMMEPGPFALPQK